MKVFIGYPSERSEEAGHVYAHVASLVEDVWFDKESLIAGEDWNRERAAAQHSADLIIHLVSPEIMVRKGVVNREIRDTLDISRDQPLGTLFVIFIRLEDFRLPVEFSRFHYLDYFKDDWRDKLSAAIQKRLEQLGSSKPLVPNREVVTETPMENSAKIEFSDSTASCDFVGQYIQYTGEGLYWQLVNASICSHALGEYFDFRADIIDDEPPATDAMKSSWELTAEEFFHQADCVSLRFYSYSYWSGAAHPNHHITSLNFLGEQHGLVKIEHLLGHHDEAAKVLLEYCEKVIVANLRDEFEEDTGDMFFEGYKDETSSIWKLISNYNVDNRGLTVNFSPYDITPYALGSHEIFVPWDFLIEFLAGPLTALPEVLSSK